MCGPRCSSSAASPIAADGPAELRPVGETEYVAGVAARAEAAGVRACAGIVGYCDFRLGERIDAVLEAHIAAGGGRFKGIRQSAGWDAAVIMTTATPAPQHLLMDPAFRIGLGRLRRFGLSYECSLYHPQLPRADRSGARVSRSADLRQPLRRTDLRRAVSRAPGGDVRRLAARPARAGALPQRGAEAGRPGDDDPRLRLSRGGAAAVVGRTRRGMASVHGDLHRGVRRRPLHVREQLPGGQGDVQLSQWSGTRSSVLRPVARMPRRRRCSMARRRGSIGWATSPDACMRWPARPVPRRRLRTAQPAAGWRRDAARPGGAMADRRFARPDPDAVPAGAGEHRGGALPADHQRRAVEASVASLARLAIGWIVGTVFGIGLGLAVGLRRCCARRAWRWSRRCSRFRRSRWCRCSSSGSASARARRSPPWRSACSSPP